MNVYAHTNPQIISRRPALFQRMADFYSKRHTSRTVLYKNELKCEIFRAPPSPVEINNLLAIKTPAPPPPEWWPLSQVSLYNLL